VREGDREFLERVREYCRYFSVPMDHLVDVISDLKVVPMIRGKGFEYFVADYLRTHLQPPDEWEVTNPNVNPQLSSHDTDVTVRRTKGGSTITIECKLAGKGSLLTRHVRPQMKVKCMRSRTVGDSMAADKMAERYGVDRSLLLNHKDNYREIDFDFVITSLENAMWGTEQTRYTFQGTRAHFDMLSGLFPNRFRPFTNLENFRLEAANFLMMARSSDLIVSLSNGIQCVRRECIQAGTNEDCEFIPNYPIIDLNAVANNQGPWRLLPEELAVFRNFTPPARAGQSSLDNSK
jgi:hypothetical protein